MMLEITKRKVDAQLARGAVQRGVTLLTPDGDQVAIVHEGAVRWLSKSDMWKLMNGVKVDLPYTHSK